MISLHEIIEYCQALAFESKLAPDTEAMWRSYCRSYSKKFNTPLPEVMRLDPVHVILSYYEDQIEPVDLDEKLADILDAVYCLENPEYEAKKRAEFDRFAEEAEEEERERLKAGRPIHPALKSQLTPSKQKTAPEPLPKSGMVNLSYLEQEENGSGDFED